jgi:hypothetical protein
MALLSISRSGCVSDAEPRIRTARASPLSLLRVLRYSDQFWAT